MQGILALDIDGTLIHGLEKIPSPVVRYLANLHRQGWHIMFLTGRTFTFAVEVVKEMPFPYIISVQNGAATVEMPQKNLIRRKYLNSDFLPEVEKIFIEEKTGPIIYTGLELEDVCYYRSELLSPEMNAYLIKRKGPFLEVWKDIAHFDGLPINHFPSIKCFGSKDLCMRISEKLKAQFDVEVTVITDPFDSNYSLAQATNPQANKGNALQEYIQLMGHRLPVIAAGDDYNDLSMLQQATIKVVMQGAPKSLLEIADIVAPSSEMRGIIPGLKRAIGML